MEPSHTHNPYETIYRSLNLQISQLSTQQDVEQLARQLNLLHCTFGVVSNDLIKLVSFRFPQNVYSNNQNSQNLCQAKKPILCLSSDNVQQYRVGYKMKAQNSAEKLHKQIASKEPLGSKKKRKRKVVQILLEESENESNSSKFRNRPQTRSQSNRSRSMVSYKCKKVNLQDLNIRAQLEVKLNKEKMEDMSFPQMISEKRREEKNQVKNLFSNNNQDGFVNDEKWTRSQFPEISDTIQNPFDSHQQNSFRSQLQICENQNKLKLKQFSLQQIFGSNYLNLKQKEQQKMVYSEESRFGSNQQDLLALYLKKNRKHLVHEIEDE